MTFADIVEGRDGAAALVVEGKQVDADARFLTRIPCNMAAV